MSTYTYRWAGDYPVVVHRTSPEGTGITAYPGHEFTTTEPFEHKDAIPVEGASRVQTILESAPEPTAPPEAETEETPA
jgi:hypothetical protein